MPSTTTPHPPFPRTESESEERSIPPRQRAFTLYCLGHRSPAIAARLNVPERTIRAWIQADLRQLAEQPTPTRRQLLQLAITRQFAIATAAWDAYHAATDTPHHEPSSSLLVGERPGERSRYLRIAHAAYREIDRLQGLYLPSPAEPQQVRIILERIPDDDEATTTDLTHGLPAEPPPPVPASIPADAPAETATPASPPPSCPTGLAAPFTAPRLPPHHPDSAAETATTTPPPSRAGEGTGGEIGGLWPGYGPNDPLPPHIADAIGLPRFRQRNRRPVLPAFAYRL